MAFECQRVTRVSKDLTNSVEDSLLSQIESELNNLNFEIEATKSTLESKQLPCNDVLSNLHRSTITDLPPALISEILNCLDPKELGIVSCVSPILHRLASDHHAWKEFYCERWGLPIASAPLGAGFSDDKSWKELGSWDMTVRVWDRALLKCLKVLRHSDWVYGLAPHDTTVASTSGSDVYIWDTIGGCLLTLLRSGRHTSGKRVSRVIEVEPPQRIQADHDAPCYAIQNALHFPSYARGNNVTSFNVLGDSSVDCGENTLFYPILHHNLSLIPCYNGSDSTLLPHLLAKKKGLPYPPPFYSQNGSINGLLSGLNYGSAQATIMNPSSQSHQSLNQQLRQVFETFQLLQLELGEGSAKDIIESSVFYLSFGKDDYLDLFLQSSSGVMGKYSGLEFASILVDQMVNVMRDLYDANVHRIICMGILPLGCTPRIVWEWRNSTAGDDEGKGCVAEVNELILQYNTMLEERIINLNSELPNAHIIFCDIYQGIMQMMNNPQYYGFEDPKTACCGLGLYGAMIGCLSVEMACERDSDYIWWDLYNPTKAVNALLADSAWSGRPLFDICRPISVRALVFTTPSHSD
ncbi:hypothetical protein CUMW_164970 [Citrus unshiu]|nr:hypothetical protein CUMW_164970 [Citrus unshiu]